MGIGTGQKGKPHKRCLGKAGGVSNVAQHAVGTMETNEGRGRFLLREFMCMSSTLGAQRARRAS
ncbi:unnamed protein product [Gulo gulo]|uniref:Uncharacterized protein n=1 Tax=Gulo gulo TaxID=48420 RepID=A0A9X9LTA0_GULGU|nr:unnamed protein product [Gulo gulo]